MVNGLCTPINDDSAPVYITIGDGGNQEGLLTEYVKVECGVKKHIYDAEGFGEN